VSLLNVAVFSTVYSSGPAADDIHDDAVVPAAAAFSDLTAFLPFGLHPNCCRHSCCCWHPFSSWWVTVAGLPAILGVPGVACMSAAFKLAVAGGPAVIGFPAVDGVLAVASISVDPDIPILACGFTYWTVQWDMGLANSRNYWTIEYRI
jgi:hypothetical protein